MSKFQNPTKVITGVNTRWSYANVWQAKSINGGAPKYSISLIIPKSDTVTVSKIKAAIEAAADAVEDITEIPGQSSYTPLNNATLTAAAKAYEKLAKEYISKFKE